MATAHERLQLTPEHWFGWQMLPGYVAEGNVPYFSPIWVNGVIPRKTGRRILALQFINGVPIFRGRDLAVVCC